MASKFYYINQISYLFLMVNLYILWKRPIDITNKQKMLSFLSNFSKENESQTIKSVEKIGEISNENESQIMKVQITKIYELKKVCIQNPSSDNIKKLINEYKIMKMLDHPNILKVIDKFIDGKSLTPSILFEYCPTNLEQEITKKTFSKLQNGLSIYFIAEGMKYLHSHQIVHSNLSPSNIFISEDGMVKIGNFEKAQLISSENESLKIDDIKSFGSIIYFILSGGEIPNTNNEEVLKSFPALAQQLISYCWSSESKNKPTFEEICDTLEKNNLNLNSLSQQEIQEASMMIEQYKIAIQLYLE